MRRQSGRWPATLALLVLFGLLAAPLTAQERPQLRFVEIQIEDDQVPKDGGPDAAEQPAEEPPAVPEAGDAPAAGQAEAEAKPDQPKFDDPAAKADRQKVHQWAADQLGREDDEHFWVFQDDELTEVFNRMTERGDWGALGDVAALVVRSGCRDLLSGDCHWVFSAGEPWEKFFAAGIEKIAGQKRPWRRRGWGGGNDFYEDVVNWLIEHRKELPESKFLDDQVRRADEFRKQIARWKADDAKELVNVLRQGGRADRLRALDVASDILHTNEAVRGAVVARMMDDDENIASRAMGLLANETNRAEVTEGFVAVLARPSPELQRSALQGLTLYGTQPLPQAAVQAVTGLLAADDADLRRAACKALARVVAPNEECINRLKETAAADRDHKVRASALVALLTLGAGDAEAHALKLNALLDGMNLSSHSEVIREVTAVFVEVDGAARDALRPIVLGGLKSEYGAIREVAAGGLSSRSTLGDEPLVRQLVDLLGDDNVEVRRSVVRLLAKANVLRAEVRKALAEARKKEADEDLRAEMQEVAERRSGVAGLFRWLGAMPPARVEHVVGIEIEGGAEPPADAGDEAAAQPADAGDAQAADPEAAERQQKTVRQWAVKELKGQSEGSHFFVRDSSINWVLEQMTARKDWTCLGDVAALIVRRGLDDLWDANCFHCFSPGQPYEKHFEAGIEALAGKARPWGGQRNWNGGDNSYYEDIVRWLLKNRKTLPESELLDQELAKAQQIEDTIARIRKGDAELLQRMLEDKDEPQRRNVLELVEPGTVAADQKLRRLVVNLLSDKDESIARQAFYRLKDSLNETDVAAAVAGLLKDGAPRIKSQLLIWLRESIDARRWGEGIKVADDLMEAAAGLMADESPDVREEVCRILASQNEAAAKHRDKLKKAADEDVAPRVKARALQALLRTDKEHAAEYAEKLAPLVEGNDEVLRAVARDVAEAYAAADKPLAEKLRPVVIRGLQSDNNSAVIETLCGLTSMPELSDTLLVAHLLTMLNPQQKEGQRFPTQIVVSLLARTTVLKDAVLQVLEDVIRQEGNENMRQWLEQSIERLRKSAAQA